MIDKILEETTFNTVKEISKLNICIPSKYSDVFISKLRDIDPNKIIDYEKDFKNEELKALEERLRNSEHIISETESIILNAVDALASQNKEELISLKKQMDQMFLKIEEITKEIYTDELTKINNRKWLFKKFLINENILPEDGSLAFIDLNDFKIINDTVGHRAGDKTLIFFSSYVNSELSRMGVDFDLVRFAGDEFIVVFRSSSHNIKLLLEQVQDSLSRKKLKYNGDVKKDFKLGFSFGVIKYKKGEDIHEVIGQADSSMYKMKKIRKTKREED